MSVYVAYVDGDIMWFVACYYVFNLGVARVLAFKWLGVRWMLTVTTLCNV
jgi:hypothetical protein